MSLPLVLRPRTAFAIPASLVAHTSAQRRRDKRCARGSPMRNWIVALAGSLAASDDDGCQGDQYVGMGRSNVFGSCTKSACRGAGAGPAHRGAGGAVRGWARVAAGPGRDRVELSLDGGGGTPGWAGCRQPERHLRRRCSGRVSSQWLPGVLRFGGGSGSVHDPRQPVFSVSSGCQTRIRRERVSGVLLLAGSPTAPQRLRAPRGSHRRTGVPRALASRWGHARRGRGSCRPRRSAHRDRPPRRCAAPRS